MTRLDDLAAEAIPDGTFGHAQPPRPRPRRPYTAEEQQAHVAELLAALRGQPAITPDTARKDRAA